jgi:two-component system, chemotaxis family, protein-glutamate methylesterase/glutaminase
MIQVMLVDDSAVIRGLIGRIVDAESDMRVAASAPNGNAALDILKHKEVDIVMLDVEMPEMDGLTALPLILQLKPGIRVIMASSLTTRGADVTMRALGLGAADYVAKPSALSAVKGIEVISRELVTKIRALGRGADHHATAPTPTPAPARRPHPIHEHSVAPRLLVVAASTGGPNALATILAKLPRDLPLPVLISQHMPALFTASLADRLQRESGRVCAEAKHGEIVENGRVYIAPGDFHMRVTEREGRIVIALDQQPPVNFCRPAADPLFKSAAAAFGPAVCAVVLTGMGEDGLRGAEAVVQNGGRVLVQDRASSVVWGMPGAIVAAGLATAVLPLEEIPNQISALCAAHV